MGRQKGKRPPGGFPDASATFQRSADFLLGGSSRPARRSAARRVGKENSSSAQRDGAREEAVTAPYLVRLLCLSLATFFLVNLAIGALLRLFAPAAIQWAGLMTPRSAARGLIALRLLPSTAAILVVLGLCVPSFVWLEPATEAEGMGFGC